MGLAIVEYFLYQRNLSYGMKQRFLVSTALVAALLISLIGLLALLNLLFNVGPI